MNGASVHLEIVLAELAYLIAVANGDPAILNGPAGVGSHFERNDVLEAGANVQRERLAVLASPEEVAVISGLFDTIGRLAAASRGVLVVKDDDRPAVTMLYFTAADAALRVMIADGRSILTVSPEPLRIAAPASGVGQLVLGWYRPSGETPHMAVADGVVAYSDDGDDWRVGVDGERNDVASALTRFVTG